MQGYPLHAEVAVNVQQFLVGISGALVGVLGWLLVGLYIQKRAHDRQARDAGRAVYFELGGNRLAIFVASEYGAFGPLSRATFERLLPELSTWLPADELQALVIAYLGHGGYAQAAEDREVPANVRKMALSAMLDAHTTALDLLRERVFSKQDLETLNRYTGAEDMRLMSAADEAGRREA
jgi:hypothetical protein